MARIKLSFTIILLQFLNPSLQDGTSGLLFNYESQNCCKGKLYPWDFPNYEDQCCGNITINAQKEVCCEKEDGSFKTVPTSGDHVWYLQGCCNGNFYNKLDNLCCKNTNLFPRKVTELCCGDAVYDHTKELCCKNKVVPKDGKRCHLKCCGDTSFDFATEICCSNKKIIKRKTGFEGCCGSKPYDKRTHLCCKGKITSRKEVGPDKLCCGMSTYSTFTQICCNEKVYDKTSIFTDCCGDVTYEKDEHLCCGEKIYNRDSPHLQCCGEKTYNYANELCCNDESFPLDENCFDHCCNKEGVGFIDTFVDDLSIVDEIIPEKKENKTEKAQTEKISSSSSSPNVCPGSVMEMLLIVTVLKKLIRIF